MKKIYMERSRVLTYGTLTIFPNRFQNPISESDQKVFSEFFGTCCNFAGNFFWGPAKLLPAGFSFGNLFPIGLVQLEKDFQKHPV